MHLTDAWSVGKASLAEIDEKSVPVPLVTSQIGLAYFPCLE